MDPGPQPGASRTERVSSYLYRPLFFLAYDEPVSLA